MKLDAASTAPADGDATAAASESQTDEQKVLVRICLCRLVVAYCLDGWVMAGAAEIGRRHSHSRVCVQTQEA